MNRFDRVTYILLLMQTRSVVTARSLSDHFGVIERTIYRDIRTLENAGVLEVLPTGSQLPVDSVIQDQQELDAPGHRAVEKSDGLSQSVQHSGDRWLRECRSPIIRLQSNVLGVAG